MIEYSNFDKVVDVETTSKNGASSKNMTKIFFLVLLLVSLVSCQRRPPAKDSFSDESKVYEVSLEKAFQKTHSVPLSTIGNEIVYIPIETNSKSVFSEISKIVISENYIFITDRQRVLQFNRDGSFVRPVGSRGRGPGEYQNQIRMDISVNEILNQLIVLDHYTHIFDFDGNQMKHFRHDALRNVDRIIPWKENQFIYHYSSLPKHIDSNENSLIILSEHNEVVKIFKNHHKRIQPGGFGMTHNAPFYSFQNNIRFKEFGCDTLYTVENDKLIPYAIFDLGNKSMPVDISLQIGPRYDPQYASRVLEQYTGKFWLRTIVEDYENFYLGLFHPADENGSLRGVCPKSTRETIILEDNNFQNDIDGGLPFFPKYVYHDYILVDWVDAFDLREHVLNGNAAEMRRLYGQKYDDLVKLAKSLHDESNQVLVMVKKNL